MQNNTSENTNKNGTVTTRIVVYIASVVLLVMTITLVTVVFGKGVKEPEVTPVTTPVEVTEPTTEPTTEEGPTILLSGIMKDDYKTNSFIKSQILGRVVSEDLGINCRLVFGTTDDCLAIGAGVHACSSLPGMKTPMDPAATCPIIAGHCRTVFVGFSNIDPNKGELPEGLTITLEMPYGNYTYEIISREVIPADDFKFSDHRASYGNFEPDTVIFYTCYPFGVANYVKTDRLFIYGKLIEGTKVTDDISMNTGDSGNDGVANDIG